MLERVPDRGVSDRKCPKAVSVKPVARYYYYYYY